MIEAKMVSLFVMFLLFHKNNYRVIQKQVFRLFPVYYKDFKQICNLQTLLAEKKIIYNI